MRRYTVRQLDTFLEIARAGSVSKAAARLHVTQPAVSMQLRQLEEALGVPLVETVGRNIRLTDAGREVEQIALAAVAQLRQLDDTAADLRGLRRGKIDLGIVGTAKYFVPMLLVHFRKHYPGIDIALQIHNREHMLNLLQRNELDLVIMGSVPATLDCVSAVFATNPLGIVSAPGHVLSRRKQAPLDILNDVDFVVREKGSGTRVAMERLLADNHITPRIVMEMPSNESIKQAVMAGMGLTFLSLRTVRRELAAGHLALLDIKGLPLVRNWHVAHLRSKRLAPAALMFKEFLVSSAAPLINTWA
ncbi:LysR family transcriptional regulator [Pollutimonas bauzanensis]|uniref:Transcriptional regulator, LysR family n=1 Tax=Pollutimonas bauzanensis TaxID=658167 RepID=A0A1M5YZG4_9BURK|nr:LysR family transcriptional regulator [Pollutimonas bauzanensis]SHI17365.1 transcriptional regulator, LysR family [Pollutimonas bauzanensis]